MLISLCGKPSVGKSTFFKACTLSDVAIAPYPFTTLKAAEGVAFVRVECIDKELNVKCNPRFGYCKNGIRFVPIKLFDVPGLIEGSHHGAGLGLEFLNDIAQTDALIQIIDCAGSTNAKGETVNPGSYDPANDIRFLEYELDMWYLSILKKGWDKLSRKVQQEKLDIRKVLSKQLSGLKVTEEMVKEAINILPEDPVKWSEKELLELASSLRKKSKPMIIAANKIDIKEAGKNFERLKKEFPQYKIIACSADSELALREASKNDFIEYLPGDKDFKITKEMNEIQKKALNYIKENVLKKYGSTGVQEILDYAVFSLLNYIAVFPAGTSKLTDTEGRILADCLLLPQNSTALDFAFKVHSDLGKNFIKAVDVKTKRILGKEHMLKHRDGIEIITK